MADLVVLGNGNSRLISTAFDASPPPRIHLLPGDPPLVFFVEGSLLFESTPEFFEQLLRNPQSAERDLLDSIPVASPKLEQRPLPAPAAISLEVAHSCNLSCSYCYADEGRFGGRETYMSQEVARSAIDLLLESNHGRRVTIGFIGGEPFLNRKLIYWAVDYATNRAKEAGAGIGFSVTTNGTLLNSEDLELLRGHAFAISVSLDGGAEVNDRERRAANGDRVFESTMGRLWPLLQSPGRARITARATITRLDMRILERITSLFDAGFKEVGVSPLRTSPVAELALRQDDWEEFLDEMVRAAEFELKDL